VAEDYGTINLIVKVKMKALPKTVSIFATLAGLWTVFYLISYGISREKVYLPERLENLLLNADQFTLFSINPDADYEQTSTNMFQGYDILGQFDIKSDATRTELVAALNQGIGAKHRLHIPGSINAAPSCFNPRHAIRVKKGNETVDLLICFQCQKIEITANQANKWYFLTSNEPATLFNEVLKQAGVPLPKD
jgi:hypothetical protein